MTNDSAHARVLSTVFPVDRFRRILVPEQLSELISRILKNPQIEPTVSFSIPAVLVERCPFCGCQTGACVLSGGREYGADLERDDDGTQRVVLTSPHRCAESQRFDFFSEREPWE